LKDKEIEDLLRQLGKPTAEVEWASKKLKRLGFNTKQQLLKSKQENTVETAITTPCCDLFVINFITFSYANGLDILSRSRFDKPNFAATCHHCFRLDDASLMMSNAKVIK
jgi:hypothetical protein